jgi:hypothetical protein
MQAFFQEKIYDKENRETRSKKLLCWISTLAYPNLL